MRIVFIGDIMGRSGREALKKHLPVIKEKLQPDIVIVNGENAANGRGITVKIAKEFYEWGVDCITTGNHVWDQREIIPHIDKDKKLLRPINYPQGTPGSGVYKHRLDDGRTIVIVNAMARLFMDAMDDPFKALRDVVAEHKMGRDVNAIFVDFHGETTSEKMALGHHLAGKVSAVIGTHTHVPTADHHVMEGGTAFMADAGMTGDYNSVIGMDKENSIRRFVQKTPGEYAKPGREEGTLCGCFIITSDKTGKAQSIQPIRMGEGGTLSTTFPEDA